MADELTEAQLAELRQALVDLRTQIGAQLEATRDGARPVDLDEPIGRLTRMDAMQQQNMTKASRRGLESQLQQVAGALAACKEGDYGLCRSCDEPIGYARLRARPETGLCVRCQERREAGSR